MGLTRPITRELTQILPRQLWQGLSLGKVEQILLDARAALNIHPEQQVGATYLAQKTPTIAGVVEDETPTRKDRTRLSCRASDFDGINQSFQSAATVTSDDLTELSVFTWFNWGGKAAGNTIASEWGAAGTKWLMTLTSVGRYEFYLSDSVSAATKKQYAGSVGFSPDEWHHIGFTFSAIDNEFKIYIDGAEAVAGAGYGLVKSSDANLAQLYDTTEPFSIGTYNTTTNPFDGQIQQPLIYEGVWSAAQVRDLYLQQTDNIPITYGWFLDSDTAHPLTSSSPVLVPANSPDLYEDDAIGGGDWLNEKGWNNSGTLAPKRWDEELDSLGNAATDSTSFGVAKRNAQLRDGPCFSFGGTEYATNGNLVGTETVVSSEGTSTPTISAGRIDFTAGTCWNLLLSNGSHYAGSERTGIIWHDDVNDEHLTFFNSPNWNLQDTYFWSESVGFSLYEHASEPDLFVPLKSDGTALSITPPSGYTKTSDNPAGPWLYEGDETYVDFDVVANANQWLEQRWQDTEGDGIGYLTLDSEITLSGVFDVEFLHYASSYASAESIIGHSSETSQIGFSSTKYFIRVLNGGSSDNTIAAPSINQWHSVKIARDSSDIVTATIDGTETTLFSGAAQSGNFVINQIFKGTLGIFTGNVRNVKITDDTTIIMDFDSLIDLDLSSSLNNTTETVTDITYNRLTDVSYTAGDVVEQPFSVNDDTSGRVSELIQFVFPVTTLSSTPTISQTIFEDGNTVTQDGILISES